MAVGGDTLAEAGKILNLTDDAALAGLGQRLAVGGIKAATGQEPTSDYGEIPIPKLSGAGYKSTMLVPTAYKDAVELSLMPFVSNVGTYLQAQGFLGADKEGEIDTSDSIALALDIGLDFGNLATLGTAKLLTQGGRVARTITTLTKGSKAGTTGADVVGAAIGVIEQAGKFAKVKPEIIAAAKAGDKAAVQSLLKGALASADITPEAASLIGQLKKDSKYLAQVLDHASEITAKGQLGPEMFLQATRAERIATKQINPLLRIAQPANPFRNPGTLFRQVVGIEYAGDKFYAPGSRLFAEGLDKILPKAGEDLAAEVSFDALRKSDKRVAGILAEAEGRAADAPTLFHSQILLDRSELLSGLQTDHITSLVTEGAIKADDVNNVARKLFNYAPGTKISEAHHEAVKRLAINAANGARAELDALTRASREATFQKILTSRTKSYEAFGVMDEVMAKADLADIRALNQSFNLTPIIADPQGVGNAIAARVSTGRMYASQQGFIAREIVRAAYPSIHDADEVANALGRFTEHMDLFEVRDGGRMFIKAGTDEAAIKEAAPLLHDALYGSADRRLLRSLTETGLHPDVHGLVAQQRAFLDAVGPVLLHEGVIGGQIGGYFPHVFQPNAKFHKTFDTNDNAAGRFFEKLVISSDGNGDLATQVLGAPLKGEFDGFLAASRQGKVTSQQARSLTERMAVAFERQGYGTYERDSLKVFAGYTAAANEALLVNRMIYDLPKSGAKLNREALVAAVDEKKADALIARIGGEAELAKIDRFHADMKTVPEPFREIFTPLTSTGRLPGGIATTTSDAAAIERGLAGAVRSPEGAAALKATLSTRAGQRRFYEAVRKDVASEFAGKTEIGGIKVLDGKGKPVEINPDWIIKNGGMPEKVKNKPALRAAWNKLIKERSVGERAESIAAALDAKFAAKVADASAANRTIYAFKGDASPLIEALRLYPSDGHSKFASWYDNFNRNLKSVVLFGDFFYFNTLGVMQFIGAPEVAMKTLLSDAALIPDILKGGFGPTLKAAGIPGRNAALNALAGALAGGVTGEALGADDAGDTLGFSLAGALYGAAIGAAIRGGRKARLETVMGQHGVETLFWMGHGTWTGRPEDRAIGVLSNGLKKAYANLARETAGQPSIRRNIVEGAIHLADAYESTLYGMLHNGGKVVLFQHYWARMLPKLEASDAYSRETLAKRFYGNRLPPEALASKLTDGEIAESFERGSRAASEFFSEYGHATKADSAEPVLRDMLSWAQSKGVSADNPHLRAAQTILDSPLFGDRRFEFSAELDGPLGRAKGGISDTKFYLSSRAFSDPEKSMRVLAHELAHVASSRALFLGEQADDLIGKIGKGAAPEQLRKFVALSGSEEAAAYALLDYKLHYRSVNRLFEDARKGLGAAGRDLYGLKNVHEFVAEAFSNRGFARKLNEIKTGNGTGSVLRDLFAAVLDMLGIKANKGTVLDGLVREMDSLGGKSRRVFGTEYAGAVPSTNVYAEGIDTGLDRYVEEQQFFLKKKLATEIVQATNNAFGGQRYAMMFGDPTIEKHLKRFLVSPDYTTSRLSFTAAMLGNMGPIKGSLMGAGVGTLVEFVDAGFDPKEMQERSGKGAFWGAAFGAIGGKWQQQVVRRMGTQGDAYAAISRRMSLAALVGGYVTYNLLNKELTGNWLHENPEGHKLSVGLPNGQYLDGVSKPFLEAFEFAGVLNPDKFPIPALSRLASKAAPPIGIAKLAFNRDYFGQMIFTPEMGPTDQLLKFGEVIIDSTTPIPLRRPLQAGGRFVFQGKTPTETDLMSTLSDISGLGIRGKPGPTGRFDPGMLDALISAPPLRLPTLGNPTDIFTGSLR